MARKARERAESGVYHIVLKGNDKLLFVEPSDYRRFLELLGGVCETDLAEVYAYCLFDEAVHLVLKEGLVYAGESLKKLVSKYALWCNAKYERDGKLFYDRFASEPLEADAVVLDAVRYVHRLPLSRGESLEYEWSSYNNYLKKSGLRSSAVLLLLDDSPLSYRMYMDEACENTFLDDRPKAKLTDMQLAAQLRELLQGVTVEEIEALSEQQFLLLLRRFKEIEGVSIRQLARVLNIGKSVIERAWKTEPKGK